MVELVNVEWTGIDEDEDMITVRNEQSEAKTEGRGRHTHQTLRVRIAGIVKRPALNIST
jgi:hypothetical protein